MKITRRQLRRLIREQEMSPRGKQIAMLYRQSINKHDHDVFRILSKMKDDIAEMEMVAENGIVSQDLKIQKLIKQINRLINDFSAIFADNINTAKLKQKRQDFLAPHRAPERDR